MTRDQRMDTLRRLRDQIDACLDADDEPTALNYREGQHAFAMLHRAKVADGAPASPRPAPYPFGPRTPLWQQLEPAPVAFPPNVIRFPGAGHHPGGRA